MEKSMSLEDREECQTVLQAFSRWRASRRRGDRIPQSLWEAALTLARQHGVAPVCRSLGLGHGDLKARLAQSRSLSREAAMGQQPAPPPTFVELSLVEESNAPAPPQSLLQTSSTAGYLTAEVGTDGSLIRQIELELKGADGAELKLRLPASTRLPLLELVSGFWTRGQL